MNKLIIKNAHIFTGTPKEAWTESLVCDGETIIALGNNSLGPHLEDFESETLDLEGKYVIPDVANAAGFLDFEILEETDNMLSLFTKKTFKSLIGDVCKNTIEVGHRATFIAYDTNPLEAIGAVHFPDPDLIVVDGQVVYDIEEFNRSLMFSLLTGQKF